MELELALFLVLFFHILVCRIYGGSFENPFSPINLLTQIIVYADVLLLVMFLTIMMSIS